jgi:preprotein translocase subunit YajC
MDLLGGALMMGAPPGGNPIIGFLPIVAMLGIMYFLLVRPQQKEAKRHQEMLDALKKGDEVVTFGGLYGRIVAFNADRVALRVDENVKVEVDRSKIMRVVEPPGSSEKAERGERAEKGKARTDRAPVNPAT